MSMASVIAIVGCSRATLDRNERLLGARIQLAELAGVRDTALPPGAPEPQPGGLELEGPNGSNFHPIARS
jgi:hypothetical protein